MNERAGIAVDAHGGAVIDPTANVIALVEANAKAAAALRDADVKFNDAQAVHLKEIADLRAEHAKETRTFDRDQSRAIREVDQTNAQATASQILQAVNTNASVAATTALTLAKQVTDTAAAQETRQSARDADTAKRLSAVELSMSKGEGKQQVSDPALTQALAALMQAQSTAAVNLAALTAKIDRGEGKTQGLSDGAKLLLGLFAAATFLMGAYTFTQNRAQASAPQVIYVPAPAGALLPTTPPQQAPR